MLGPTRLYIKFNQSIIWASSGWLEAPLAHVISGHTSQCWLNGLALPCFLSLVHVLLSLRHVDQCLAISHLHAHLITGRMQLHYEGHNAHRQPNPSFAHGGTAKHRAQFWLAGRLVCSYWDTHDHQAPLKSVSHSGILWHCSMCFGGAARYHGVFGVFMTGPCS